MPDRDDATDQSHSTPMGKHLLRARNTVVSHRITVGTIRTRAKCSTQAATKLFDKTVLRRATVEATTVDELKQVLHEIINML